MPPLIDRIAHAGLVEVLHGPVVRAASPRSFAYLPGRDRILALGCARKVVREGFVFAAKLDVSRFFPTTRVSLVRRALRADHPTVDPSLRRVVGFLYHAPIIRSPRHRHVREGTAATWESPRDTLLPGPASAPLLSEIVGHHVIDRHFEDAWLHDAHVLRYADDVLILGRSPRAVRSTMQEVICRLRDVGLDINQEKSVTDPIDLRDAELGWLGKTLRSGDVLTSSERFLRLASRLELDSTASQITLLTELTLEPRDSFRGLLDELGWIGPHAAARLHLVDWKRRRRDILQRVARHADAVLSATPR